MSTRAVVMAEQGQKGGMTLLELGRFVEEASHRLSGEVTVAVVTNLRGSTVKRITATGDVE